MKKALILFLCLGIVSLAARSALAHRDTSFTFDSTAGMFEDMYDYFKFSPAYLPSFQKNALWTQLSNLENGGDHIFNNSAPANQFLIGTQIDVSKTFGAGRLGLMTDWLSSSASFNFADANGINHSGFGESKTVVKQDLNADGALDLQTESYSAAKKISNDFSNDIYLAYGFGKMMGMDVGAGLRATWSSNSPTFDGFQPFNPSFEETTQVRQFDLVNNNNLLFASDRIGTGSLSYGSSNYNLILSGRTKELMPDLDMVINVGPILRVVGNSLTYQLENNTNFAPSGPTTSINNSTTRLTGIEPGSGFIPGSGIGFFGQARGDYLVAKDINFTGQLGYVLRPQNYGSDAKLDRSTIATVIGPGPVPTDQQTVSTDNIEHNKYEGSDTFSDLVAKARWQFMAKGWKLGLGIGVESAATTVQTTNTSTFSNVNITSGNSNLGNNNTTTISGGFNSVTKVSNVSTSLELPVGLVINILDNLPIRFGARHLITLNSNATKAEFSPTQTSTVAVDGNGVVTASASGSNAVVVRQDNSYSMSHSNSLVYGASWWPNSQIQIDFTGFSNLLQLSNYFVSFNFYF